MEPAELDTALDELEVRLERLRALYDQYFLGIEKLEPLIARKDVDRRIYLLRREKIRNTGRRFKFQTLIQRYNTFQQYWQRIVREIENGTYRRHVLRAERTVGPSELLTVAARRRFGRERARKDAEVEEPRDTPESLQGPSSENDRRGESSAPEAPAPPLTKAQPLPPLAKEPKGPKEPSPLPAASERPAKPSPTSRPLESLELDMDFMGDWDPAERAPAASAARAPAPPARRAPAAPAEPAGRRLAPPPKPSPKEPAAAPPPAQPAPANPPPAPVSAQEQRPRRRQRSTHPGLGPPAPQQPSAARPAASSTLSEERLRTLHTKLLEETRKTNAPSVSLESMAKSLRAAEARLRAQHGASRRIEFEVIVRDGKPAIKPIVR